MAWRHMNWRRVERRVLIQDIGIIQVHLLLSILWVAHLVENFILICNLFAPFINSFSCLVWYMEKSNWLNAVLKPSTIMKTNLWKKHIIMLSFKVCSFVFWHKSYRFWLSSGNIVYLQVHHTKNGFENVHWQIRLCSQV